MSLKNNLQNLINREIKIDEIYRLATQERYYKQSCVERRLRELTQAKIIEPIEQNGYIIAYKPKNTPTGQILPNNGIIDLDDKLKNILKTIKPSFDTFIQIKEIQDAIKSKYNTTKEMVIKKYE